MIKSKNKMIMIQNNCDKNKTQKTFLKNGYKIIMKKIKNLQRTLSHVQKMKQKINNMTKACQKYHQKLNNKTLFRTHSKNIQTDI